MAIERRTEEKETSPFTLMRRLSDDMERMFEDTWGARRFPRLFRGLDVPESRWTPNIEAFERKGRRTGPQGGTEGREGAEREGVLRKRALIRRVLSRPAAAGRRQSRRRESHVQRRRPRDRHAGRQAAGKTRPSTRDQVGFPPQDDRRRTTADGRCLQDT